MRIINEIFCYFCLKIDSVQYPEYDIFSWKKCGKKNIILKFFSSLFYSNFFFYFTLIFLATSTRMYVNEHYVITARGSYYHLGALCVYGQYYIYMDIYEEHHITFQNAPNMDCKLFTLFLLERNCRTMTINNYNGKWFSLMEQSVAVTQIIISKFRRLKKHTHS